MYHDTEAMIAGSDEIPDEFIQAYNEIDAKQSGGLLVSVGGIIFEQRYAVELLLKQSNEWEE